MLDVRYSEGITEVIDILEHIDSCYKEKIPKKFLTFLYENKSEEYKPMLDYSKKINELELKEKTKDILAIIYANYWCSEEEKKRIYNIFKENEKKYRQEAREMYNPYNLFKTKKV